MLISIEKAETIMISADPRKCFQQQNNETSDRCISQIEQRNISPTLHRETNVL